MKNHIFCSAAQIASQVDEKKKAKELLLQYQYHPQAIQGKQRQKQKQIWNLQNNLQGNVIPQGRKGLQLNLQKNEIDTKQ